MKLGEINAIVNTKDNVNMVEVAKELLKQKANEGELVTFNRIYMYDAGDPGLYLTGLALVNGNLICVAETVYGGDTYDVFVGTIDGRGELTPDDDDGFLPNEDFGIVLTDEAIKKACQRIINGKTKIDFDFKTMESRDDWYLNGDYFEEFLEERPWAKEKVKGFCDGSQVGCINW